MRTAFSLLFFTTTLAAQPPMLPDGTAEAQQQILKLQTLPSKFKVDVWAAEPMLGNPVAFGIDEKGRIFTAESYRFNRGTEEYRTRPFFLEGDLQNKTTADRLALYKKFESKFPGGMDYFSKYSERIRLLEDTKGAGKADKATTFAEGFNEPLDGLAAGVLAKDGDVYFTCIPHLWKLDAKGNKQKLLSGFGVQNAFLGHDLHGLIFGPDGKLYFSVGDRGYHVTSKEGKTFSGPRTGAVFRCDPDGKNFEVVHTGLRNPQELAFDQFGNLFAADNNCDKGDHSRLVYIVEGGDSGWRMDYQTMEAPYLTGPWHAEKLWHLQHEGQPAWIVPPVGKLGAGPSGFTFTSGLGMPERYKNAFLMCNFSSSKGGGIDAFRVVPKGAGFELVDYHQMIGPGLITDCEQGYDGKLYYSDWVQFQWDGGGPGKGRIFAAYDPKTLGDPAIAQMKKVMFEGFKQRETKELVELLRHADMRVRLRAQYELAARKATEEFIELVKNDKNQLVRIHAIWGLGQIAKTESGARVALLGLLDDDSAKNSTLDAESTAQIAKVIGDVFPRIAPTKEGRPREVDYLLNRLGPETAAREQFFAMQSLGKLGFYPAAADLGYFMQRATWGQDPFISHACVVALSRLLMLEGEWKKVVPFALYRKLEGFDLTRIEGSRRGERLGLLLSLRQLNHPPVFEFLKDVDESVVAEAARAINDLPMKDGWGALAKLSDRFRSTPPPNEALGRRIINANFRLGGDERAKALLDIAANPKTPPILRSEALACLGEWAQPGPRDRVIGAWRPLPPRSADGVRKLVAERLENLLTNASGPLQTDVMKMVAKLDVKIDDATFTAWVKDAKKPINTRIEALRILAQRQRDRAFDLLQEVIEKDKEPRLRAVARELYVERSDKYGILLLGEAILKGEFIEKQSAIRVLGRHPDPRRFASIQHLFEKRSDFPLGLQLDIYLAAKAFKDDDDLPRRVSAFEQQLRKDSPLGLHRLTLEGGDAERGKHLFWSHTAAQCVRCHKVEGQGGDVGPDLSTWALKGNREHFVESLIFPDKKITPGYGVVTLILGDGRTLNGTVVSEDKEKLTLLTAAKVETVIALANIELRTDAKSAMPAVTNVLTLEEIRDVIEYLASLKK